MPKNGKLRRWLNRLFAPSPQSYLRTLLVYVFESNRFDKEIKKSKQEFWGDNIPKAAYPADPSLALWADWFVHRRLLRNGTTPLQTFLRIKRKKMSPQEISIYQELKKKSTFGIFEVKEIKRGRSVTVGELCTGKIYVVRDKFSSRQLKTGFIISTFVFSLQSDWHFSGSLALWPIGLKEYIPGYVEELAAAGTEPGSERFVPALERARRSAYLKVSDNKQLKKVMILYEQGPGSGWKRALKLLRRMVEDEPFNPYVNLFYGLLSSDNPAEMELRLRLAQAVVPNLVELRGINIDSCLESALENQRKFKEIIAAFQGVIEWDPDDVSTLFNLARSLIELKCFDEAEDLYRKAILHFPDYHLGHFCLGELLQKRGQDDQVRQQYELALQKAYWQLQQWPGCIDGGSIEEMEEALRSVGGDPTKLPPHKPSI